LQIKSGSREKVCLQIGQNKRLIGRQYIPDKVIAFLVYFACQIRLLFFPHTSHKSGFLSFLSLKQCKYFLIIMSVFCIIFNIGTFPIAVGQLVPTFYLFYSKIAEGKIKKIAGSFCG